MLFLEWSVLALGTVSIYVLSIWCIAAVRSWLACKRAARLTHPGGSIPLAELALQSGTKLLLICGGEPERDILGAKLGAQLARSHLRHGGGGLAFFSSGHFKKLQDFDPHRRDNDWEGRRDPFVGIDLEMLQQVLVLDREALDTFSNFTTFLRQLRGFRPVSFTGIESSRPAVDVVIVTSGYHAPRVRSIAWVLLGFYGLSFHIAEASTQNAKPESIWRCARDLLRAALWLLCGFEGDHLAGLMHRDRQNFRRWYRQKCS